MDSIEFTSANQRDATASHMRRFATSFHGAGLESCEEMPQRQGCDWIIMPLLGLSGVAEA